MTFQMVQQVLQRAIVTSWHLLDLAFHPAQDHIALLDQPGQIISSELRPLALGNVLEGLAVLPGARQLRRRFDALQSAQQLGRERRADDELVCSVCRGLWSAKGECRTSTKSRGGRGGTSLVLPISI